LLPHPLFQITSQKHKPFPETIETLNKNIKHFQTQILRETQTKEKNPKNFQAKSKTLISTNPKLENMPKTLFNQKTKSKPHKSQIRNKSLSHHGCNS